MKKNVYFKLFISTLYLSAFTFGGGYVIITLLKSKFVDELHWIDEEEMLDLAAIAQSAPGPIAINGAIVVGFKLGGIPGVLLSILGAVLPPFIILTTISFFYESFKQNIYIQAVLKGMQAGVAAVIVSVVYDMGNDVVKTKNLVLIGIMILAFVANYVFGLNVVYIIITVGLFGVVRTIIREKKRGIQV
ncbi:MAG: chromate transporter [Anaerorhabdus sp.]|uniref:chromate transporter n=1 Tax=Anaerorhabdus sp. TaxID=1872524 RepID=UPI002B1F38C0|nr:chromate transporter [Anaerorhabdus sp.]MEA4874516.1 chromate transporter [Anaerorhabdus sp.]